VPAKQCHYNLISLTNRRLPGNWTQHPPQFSPHNSCHRPKRFSRRNQLTMGRCRAHHVRALRDRSVSPGMLSLRSCSLYRTRSEPLDLMIETATHKTSSSARETSALAHVVAERLHDVFPIAVSIT
jgi:hypothetical protein